MQEQIQFSNELPNLNNYILKPIMHIVGKYERENFFVRMKNLISTIQFRRRL